MIWEYADGTEVRTAVVKRQPLGCGLEFRENVFGTVDRNVQCQEAAP